MGTNSPQKWFWDGPLCPPLVLATFSKVEWKIFILCKTVIMLTSPPLLFSPPERWFDQKNVKYFWLNPEKTRLPISCNTALRRKKSCGTWEPKERARSLQQWSENKSNFVLFINVRKNVFPHSNGSSCSLWRPVLGEKGRFWGEHLQPLRIGTEI